MSKITPVLLVAIMAILLLSGCVQQPSDQDASGSATTDDFTLWATHSTVKVRPDDAIQSSNYAWDGKEVKIKSAKNEHEPFQVVITAKDNDLDKVMVSVSDLTGNGTISKENIKVYYEYYIEVKKPTGRIDSGVYIIDPRVEYNTKEKYNRKIGFYPDALVPLTNEFSIKAKKNHAVWIDVFVPKNASAGNYSGTITATIDGKKAELPLKLTVWDFALPDKLAFKTEFYGVSGIFHDDFTGLTDDDYYLQSDAYITKAKQYYKQLADHGFYSFATYLAPKVTIDGNDVSIDFTSSDKVVDYMLNELDYPFLVVIPNTPMYDALRAYANYSEEFAYTEAETAQNLVLLKNYWKIVIEHYAEKGWLDKFYFYSVDEPGRADAYEKIRELTTYIRSINQNAKVFVGEPPLAEREEFGTLVGYAEFWAVGFRDTDALAVQIYSPEQLFNAIAERQNAGEKVIIYCALCSDPEPNFLLDTVASSARIMPLVMFNYGFDTFEQWFLDWWSDANGNLVSPWGETMNWNDVLNTGNSVNGDGSLVYPGSEANKYTGQENVDGIVFTIRTDLLYQGHEDYEYAMILKNLGGSPDALIDKIVKSSLKWEHEPEGILAVREQLAKEILTKSGKSTAGLEFMDIPSPSQEFLDTPITGKTLCYEQYKLLPPCADQMEYCKAYYKIYCDTGKEPSDEEVNAEMGKTPAATSGSTDDAGTTTTAIYPSVIITQEQKDCYDGWKDNADYKAGESSEEATKDYYERWCSQCLNDVQDGPGANAETGIDCGGELCDACT